MFLQFVHLMKKNTQETEREKIMWGAGNPLVWNKPYFLHSKGPWEDVGTADSGTSTESRRKSVLCKWFLFLWNNSLIPFQEHRGIPLEFFTRGRYSLLTCIHTHAECRHRRDIQHTVSVFWACRTMTPGQYIFLHLLSYFIFPSQSSEGSTRVAGFNVFFLLYHCQKSEITGIFLSYY